MWLEEIFKGGTEGIFAGVKNIISTFKADPLELARLQAAVNQAEMTLVTSLSQAQTRINEIEAASQDKYVSRWRPTVGWCGVIGLGYATLFHPLATWICLNLQATPPPQLSIEILMPLLTGILGIASMRSYEKYKGVA